MPGDSHSVFFTIDSRRRVYLPKPVMEKMGIRVGDRLEVAPDPELDLISLWKVSIRVERMSPGSGDT